MLFVHCLVWSLGFGGPYRISVASFLGFGVFSGFFGGFLLICGLLVELLLGDFFNIMNFVGYMGFFCLVLGIHQQFF